MNEQFKSKISAAIKKSFKVNTPISFTKLFQLASAELKFWKPQKHQEEGLIDVIDFFSGCGGMSLGFSALSQRENIFNLKGGIDINETALKSYGTNFRSRVLNQDIRELCSDDGCKFISEYFGIVKKEKPLVIIGCAPCQGFTAHRKKNWHKDDERNTLIGAFSDIALKFDPDFIVMENVPEILGKKYWEHYAEAQDILTKNGYKIKQTIYNSASFGVPQARFRTIIIAAKADFSLPIPVLSSDEFVTVRDAIGDLPPVKAGEVARDDPYHRSARHKKSTLETISQVPVDGGSRPIGVGPECLDKVNGFYDVYGRLYWDKPAITLTQYSRNPASGRFTHPEQNRGLTIREATRLQSFPDSFYFHGSLDNCFKQIGEAVPPLLSLAIATQILLEMSTISRQEEEIVHSISTPVSSSYSSVIASIKSKELVV